MQTITALLSIVLPIHKQSHHIRQVVRAYEAELTQILHESILVVNGCEDSSLDVCNALAEQYETVRTTYSEQKGWGRRHEGAAHLEKMLFHTFKTK